MRIAVPLLLLMAAAPAQAEETAPMQVKLDNFVRAETDTYFAGFVKDGALGRFVHARALAGIDEQSIVRMNRDTIYSRGLFDLDAGPVTVTLPDSGGRFLSLMVLNEDHYALDTFYAPGTHRFTRDEAGTRYLALLVRTFVNPADPADLAKVHALQDAIRVEQASPGRFEAPQWDVASLTSVREELKKTTAVDPSKAFGRREVVDPRQHLLGTAFGWGGNPAKDATYVAGRPEGGDGRTVYRLTVKDVPVDGFWSISVYNKDGYFEPNPENAYSLNNVTAKQDADGAYVIQFGGCGAGVANCLPITPGWNYTVRLYRPRAEILDGRWKFPEPVPVG